ncbi:MAG: hypothetical protein ACRD0K_10075 [Egibacteraceae bacterium]
MAKSRSLSIKVRVIAPRGTPMALKVRTIRAVAEGKPVPAGWRIRFVDWSRGSGDELESGHYADAKAMDALRAFSAALLAAGKIREGFIKPVPRGALEE